MKLQAKHRHDIDILANINALLSGFALYPQVYKVFNTGSVEDLAYSTFLIIFANSLVWLIYAQHQKIRPLFVSSMLNAAAAGYILFVFP